MSSQPTAILPRACPRCGATLQDAQDWCLECGLAVDTRVAPTPRWKRPLVAAGTLTAVALAALAAAFAIVTHGDNPVSPAPTAPAAAPADQQAPAPTAPPATSQPTTTPAPTTTPTAPQTTTP